MKFRSKITVVITATLIFSGASFGIAPRFAAGESIEQKSKTPQQKTIPQQKMTTPQKTLSPAMSPGVSVKSASTYNQTQSGTAKSSPRPPVPPPTPGGATRVQSSTVPMNPPPRTPGGVKAGSGVGGVGGKTGLLGAGGVAGGARDGGGYEQSGD